MCVAFPGGAPAIQLLGDLVYRDLRGAESKPEYKALNACLAWRWAHTRSTEHEMFKRLNMLKDEVSRDLWSKIKPLVEAAWNAPDTREVIRTRARHPRNPPYPRKCARAPFQGRQPGRCAESPR